CRIEQSYINPQTYDVYLTRFSEATQMIIEEINCILELLLSAHRFFDFLNSNVARQNNSVPNLPHGMNERWRLIDVKLSANDNPAKLLGYIQCYSATYPLWGTYIGLTMP
ncbi:hypothetical protein NEHOM01_2534, partial [Nematocida homosporus]|uniref:uncharacterized protein n=1 Tax=Nematocida homosporus TaxID=1912981 RepID=UPI00221F7A14